MNRDEADRMMTALDVDYERERRMRERPMVMRIMPMMAALASSAMPAITYRGSVPGQVVKTKRQPNQRTMAKRKHAKREARRVAELARAVAARKAGQA